MANWPWCQLVLWQVSSLWNYYCGSLPLDLLAASIFRTSQPLRVGNERRRISRFRGYLEIRSCSSKQNRSKWCLIFAFWKLECCIFQCMFLKCVLLLRIFLNLNYWRQMCQFLIFLVILKWQISLFAENVLLIGLIVWNITLSPFDLLY